MNEHGSYMQFSQSYAGSRAEDIYDSLISLFAQVANKLPLNSITAIGLSSQCGTYMLYGAETENTMHGWLASGGEQELEEFNNLFDDATCIEHITMRSPKLVSYPGPRSIWFQKHMPQEWKRAEKYIQPKDYVYHRLTDTWFTDKYSWRGLANNDGTFHQQILDGLGIDAGKLPDVVDSCSAPAGVSRKAAKELGIPEGIPVTVGSNDYFAALVGMGVLDSGQGFDVTGTSEHIGGLFPGRIDDSRLISGPFFDSYVYYGVTASSGPSMSWAMNLFNGPILKLPTVKEIQQAPLFLPYLKGERAPIWQSNAQAVFSNLRSDHTLSDFRYSVFEGVCLSIYHIWSFMKEHPDSAIRVSGGASIDPVMNRMKASLLNRSYHRLNIHDTSALGAAMYAAVGGVSWFSNLHEAAHSWVQTAETYDPDQTLGDVLRERFTSYERLVEHSTPMWRNS
jgi:sugar (pentulose or hexulose) kinase